MDSAEGQSRTVDTWIFSPLLYRLSYLGSLALQSLSKLAAHTLNVNRNNLGNRRIARLITRIRHGPRSGGVGRTPGPVRSLAVLTELPAWPVTGEWGRQVTDFGYFPSTVLSSKWSMNSM